MPGPTGYKPTSITPKKRISTTRPNGTSSGFQQVGDSTNPQYVAQSPKTSAFVAPGAGLGSGIGGTTTGTTATPQTSGSGAGISAGVGGTTQTAGTGPTVDKESLYGFAGRHFAPDDLTSEFWQNPWMIADFAMQDRGQGGNRYLIDLMRQFASSAMPLYTIVNGLTDDPSQAGGSAATINYIERLMNSMTRKGGHLPSYEGLLGNLLAARGTDSMLGGVLNRGTDPNSQVGTFMTYLNSALGTNMLNPIVQAAIRAQADEEGNKFMLAKQGGQDAAYSRNFTDWLNSGGHRLYGDPRY